MHGAYCCPYGMPNVMTTFRHCPMIGLHPFILYMGMDLALMTSVTIMALTLIDPNGQLHNPIQHHLLVTTTLLNISISMEK